MSRARHEKHHRRANGGPVKAAVYAGEGSNLLKEAHERKRGGRVHHMHGEGEESKHRHDRKERRHGGRAEHHAAKHHEEHEKERKHGGKVEHEEHHHEKMHMHKGRARGGRIGSNRAPLSTAATVKHVTKGETPEAGDDFVT